jgi:prepilin signal peptidase PulO-like enzyme (type II secretory pathway)
MLIICVYPILFLMTILITVFLFILWTILGSFGWVIIERAKDGFAWNERWKVFGWRSYCPWCDGKLLVSWQLIPLLWWLIQRWKCFRCKLPIPTRYCWIELIMGVMFVITGWWILWMDPSPELIQEVWWALIGWLGVTWLLTLIIIHDIMTQELNLYTRVMLLVLSVVLIFTMSSPIRIGWFVWSIVLTAVFGAIYLWAKRYATRKNNWTPTEWFGEWDVMVAMLLWLLSGPLIAQWGVVMSIQMVFIYLIVSSVLWILFYLLTHGSDIEHERKIPFLPAMIIARWGIVLWSQYFF